MADVESNILEHEAEFRAFVEGISFLLPGKDQSLGRDVAVAAAEGIIERTVIEQKDASGGELKALNPIYKARKVKKRGVEKIGVLSGQMLSLQSVLGDLTIGADVVEMRYGTGEAASGYATGGEAEEESPTDRQKAEWFTEQGRPFYELDETIGDRISGVIAEALDDYLGET